MPDNRTIFGTDIESRVALFVDGQNLYSAARSVDMQLDFSAIYDAVDSGSILVRAHYYTPLAENDEFSPVRPLVDYLDYNGWTVSKYPVREYTDGEGRRRLRSANVSVEMAVDALQMAQRIDHAVFFSGDNDILPIIKALKTQGIKVTVVSSQSSVADEIRRAADVVVLLENIREKVGRKPSGTSQGFTPRRSSTSVVSGIRPRQTQTA